MHHRYDAPLWLGICFFCLLIIGAFIFYDISYLDHRHIVQKTRLWPLSYIGLVHNINPVRPVLKSDKRGYVALLYSGTARSFSANFESHIINLMAGCPYTVHLFFHTYINDNRFPQSKADSIYANYLSVNSTLAYFKGYINLDNERVLFRDAIKANVFANMPLHTLRAVYKDTYDVAMIDSNPRFPTPGLYYMWHSQRRGEELRQQYMATTGINYKWTFRMRHDAVYFTNWWQQGFNIEVYNLSNTRHKAIRHDISSDWGVRATRLYDMVYEPRLQINHTLYVPFGWSWDGYNDQFAVMSSLSANHYFTRILHIDRMLREGKVHPETSIRLVARWNNITVNNRDGTICCDIVRAIWNSTEPRNRKTRPTWSCEYKTSGQEDCDRLCPVVENLNKALRKNFILDASFRSQKTTTTDEQNRSLLNRHLTRIRDDTLQIDLDTSSFYYFYRYIPLKNVNGPCLLTSWTPDQSNNFAIQHLPFVLRASDKKIIAMYNRHLTCGLPVKI